MEPKYLEVEAEVRYWEDAAINGQEDTHGALVPFREGALWSPRIRLHDGWIVDWPSGVTAYIHYKVCDQGQYWLADDFVRIAKWRGDYVPDEFLCHGDTGYGDYIIFAVGPDGSIHDWNNPVINADEWTAMNRERGE